MATKAERFRYAAERSGPKRAPRPGRPRRDVPVDTAAPGISATDRRAGGGSTAMRNFSSARATRRAFYALEDSEASHRPSRKSSRRSSGRVKTDASVKRRIMKQIEGPTARHIRRSP